MNLLPSLFFVVSIFSLSCTVTSPRFSLHSLLFLSIYFLICGILCYLFLFPFPISLYSFPSAMDVNHTFSIHFIDFITTDTFNKKFSVILLQVRYFVCWVIKVEVPAAGKSTRPWKKSSHPLRAFV